MSTIYKVLGQSAPAATTASDLYTVPANTQAVCSTLSVCNRGGDSSDVRLSVRPAGASQANQHYLVFDNTVVGKDTMLLTLGISLAPTDVVTVYSETANVSFSLFGVEIT